jgi:hypothetical protein
MNHSLASEVEGLRCPVEGVAKASERVIFGANIRWSLLTIEILESFVAVKANGWKSVVMEVGVRRE